MLPMTVNQEKRGSEKLTIYWIDYSHAFKVNGPWIRQGKKLQRNGEWDV